MFREVTPQPKCLQCCFDNVRMIPCCDSSVVYALNDSQSQPLPRLKATKLLCVLLNQSVCRKGRQSIRPKSVVSAEKSREPQESEWNEITEGKARSQKDEKSSKKKRT